MKTTNTEFTTISSIPAGFVDLENPNSEISRVENICFTGEDNEFIVTSAYNKDIARIWEVSSGKLVQELKGEADLNHVIDYYSHSFITVEGNNKIICWRSEESIESNFGIEWKPLVKTELPEIEEIPNPIIKQLLLHDSFSVIALVCDSNKPKSAIFRWYRPGSQDSKIELVRTYDTEIDFIKNLEQKRIAAIKKSETNPKVFIGSYEYNLTDAEILYDNRELIGIGKGSGLKYMGERIYEWEKEFSSKKKDSIVATGTYFNMSDFSVIAHYDHRILVAVADEFSIIYILKPNSQKVLSELKGHRKKITKLVWESDFLISASKDKTIRLWDVFKGKEIGCFDNCHPLMHPFKFKTGIHNYFTYADVDGYVHVYRCNYKL